MQTDLDYRTQLGRDLIGAGAQEETDATLLEPTMLPLAESFTAKMDLLFPASLAPVPQPLDREPQAQDALPQADVVVITWTLDEVRALADVLTPGYSPTAEGAQVPKKHWYPYRKDFESYLPLIRDHAPSRHNKRLGSYFLTKIGQQRVLCFKSELHLNQDGKQTPPGAKGNATLPIKKLLEQLIEEVKPTHLFTVGTAGAVFAEHDLGDVVVTRAARFRLQSEFKLAPFNNKIYTCDWPVPTRYFNEALALMKRFKDELTEPDFLPPTVNFAPLTNLPRPIRTNDPDIHLDGADLPAFHPVLTTDYFEFGTSTNRLDAEGAAVEMGDAVIGLLAEERAAVGKAMPRWLIIRNCSDPQINGALKSKPAAQSVQIMWAVYYYKGFGYWTSIMSALTTWGIISGL